MINRQKKTWKDKQIESLILLEKRDNHTVEQIDRQIQAKNDPDKAINRQTVWLEWVVSFLKGRDRRTCRQIKKLKDDYSDRHAIKSDNYTYRQTDKGIKEGDVLHVN